MDAPDTERFFGRADALAELEDAFASAVRGHPGLVLVTGDAGIGKSTLVGRFTNSTTEARVLRGGCFGLVSTELPYGPVVQALRPVADDSDRAALSVDSTTLCAELGGSVAAAGEATRWSQSRLFESTLRLLGELARQRPLVLVLEDVHWADRATLDLLLFVLGNLVSERILILLTSREDEPDAPLWLDEGLQRLTRNERARIVELGPLDPDDALALVGAVAGETRRDRDDRVVERAGGNPLFLTELAASPAGIGAVPRRLRDLLLLRAHRLTSGGQRLVEILSAATTPLDPVLLVGLLGDALDDPAAAVAEAHESRLLDEDPTGRLRLRHALLGEAVYAAMPATARMSAHERLASVMDSTRADDAAAVVAYHWEHAGRPERVPDPLARSARAASSCFAFAAAARAWERLLALWDVVPEACAATGLDRATVLVEAARAHRFGPTPERGIRPLEEAQPLLAADPSRAALAAEQLARHLVDLGRVEDAMRAVDDAERLAEQASATVRSRVLSTHAGALMMQGRYEESRRCCEAALRAAPDEDSWERAHALSVLGVDLVNQGDVTAALEALDEAMVMSRRLEDPEAAMRIFVNRTYILETVGRYPEAISAADEGLAYAEQQDMYVVAGTLLLGNKASALIATGALREARAALTDAVARPGPPAWLLYAQLRLAEVEVALGELPSAQRRLAEAESAEGSADSVMETQLRLVRALLALARTEPDKAFEQARAELVRDRGGTEPAVGLQLYAVGLRGLALGAARSPGDDVGERAAELMKAAEALRDQAPLRPCQDLFDLCSLEYRECHGGAEPQAWGGLADRLADGGLAGLAPYAYLRAATGLLAAEGRRAAWPALRRAWQLLEPQGDVPLAREVAALAATCRLDLSAPLTAAAPPAEVPFGLTPREVQVLALVCGGATNRQIARTLRISERTAGVHVSHILAKLHARNRAEAIAIAHRTGAVPTAP